MVKKISLLLGLLFIIGCAGKTKILYSPIYSSGRNYVKLMKTVDKKTGEPLEAAYDHPQELAQAKLQHWLNAIYYEHYQWSSFGFDNKWVKGRVFEPKIIAEIAPQLSRAFSQATASDIIQFSVNGQDGDTSGKMWLKDNQWVCELYQIEGYGYKGEDATKLDNHDWRLVEAGGLKVSEDWAKKCFLVAINLQTKLAELQQPQADAATIAPLVTSTPIVPIQTTDQKLRLLKQWLDEGLITQEQYQQKVDSLLKEF